MASRTAERVNLPGFERRSLRATDMPQVEIPALQGGAVALQALGGIAGEAAKVVGEIDRKNQEMAAEKQAADIFLGAQKEIADFQATATGDEDITGTTAAIYEKHISGLEGRGLPSRQVDMIRRKLQSRAESVALRGLDFELKLKAQKYDADLAGALDSMANIVAGDPSLFDEQLKSAEALIASSRLNGAEKAQRLDATRQAMGRVYLSRLSEVNPAKARAEIMSERMNGIIDPGFKTSLLGKLDNEARALANVQLSDDIKSIERARAMGITLPREFIEGAAVRARAAGQERTAAGLSKFAGLQEWNAEFAARGTAEQQFEIRELRMKAQLGDLTELDKLELAQESYKEKLTALKSDPWGYYAAKGVVEPQDSSLLDAAPESAAVILQKRRLEQEKVRGLEGGRMTLPLVTPQEVAELSSMKDTADPRRLAATLTRLGSGMTGEERRATVAAVAAKEPELATAMGLDFDKAARLVAGMRTKGEVTPGKLREAANQELAGLTLDGAVNDMLHDSLYAYYKQLALEKGDAGKEVNPELLSRAISETVGDIAEIGLGEPSRVIVPADMREWEVEDRLGAITDDVLKEQQGQLPMTSDGFWATAEDILRWGRFLSAGDGLYAVRLPTGVLYRDDGTPYTIDIRGITDTQASVTRRRLSPENALTRSRMGAFDANR